MVSPDSAKWLEAMKSEMRSMYENKVQTLVDLPDDRQAIENKWIFKRKTDADSSVTIYKARIVAKRFFDKFKVLTTMRVSHSYLCLSLSESCQQLPHFMKSGKWINKTAFLNGFIKEELYMMQPEGFVNPKGANKICKLQRSIYGLVQASRSWNIRFDKLIKGYSFIQTCGEACIYKKVSGSTTTFLISICV